MGNRPKQSNGRAAIKQGELLSSKRAAQWRDLASSSKDIYKYALYTQKRKRNLHFIFTARIVTYFTRQRVVAFGFRFSVEVHKSQSLFVCLSEPRKCVQEVRCLLYRISNTFCQNNAQPARWTCLHTKATRRHFQFRFQFPFPVKTVRAVCVRVCVLSPFTATSSIEGLKLSNCRACGHKM